MTGRAVAAVAAALVLAACTGGDDGSRPTSTTRPTPSTSVIDLSGVALPAVAGETTSTVRETGTARLTGTVTGPSGPVAEAVVRAERLVAGREIRTEVTTGPDGRFALDGVPGGRYRLRAFLPPSLAQTAPEIRFVSDGDEHSFDLVVEAFGGVQVLTDIAPDIPLVGGPVNLVVRVVDRQVDPDGIVRAVGVSGVSVQLTGLGSWTELRGETTTTTTAETTSTLVSITSSTSTTSTTSTTVSPASTLTARTDQGGQARFDLRCERPGAPGLTLLVPVRTARPDPAGGPDATVVETSERPFPLELPSCVAEATTTTTSVSDDRPTTTTTTAAG